MPEVSARSHPNEGKFRSGLLPARGVQRPSADALCCAVLCLSPSPLPTPALTGQAYQKCSGQSQQLRKDITHCNNELSAYGRAALAGDAL